MIIKQTKKKIDEEKVFSVKLSYKKMMKIRKKEKNKGYKCEMEKKVLKKKMKINDGEKKEFGRK